MEDKMRFFDWLDSITIPLVPYFVGCTVLVGIASTVVVTTSVVASVVKPQDDSLILIRQGQIEQIIENQGAILEAVSVADTGRQPPPTADTSPPDTQEQVKQVGPWMDYVGGWIDQVVNMIILVATMAYGAKKIQERRKKNV